LDPQFLLVRYAEDRTLNRDDVSVAAGADRKFERGRWINSVIYRHDTTITSELQTSGITEFNLPHEHLALTTAPSMQLTELWSVGATASWSEDQYSGDHSVGLVDYNYSSLGAQLGYSLSERSSLQIDASVGRFYLPVDHSVTNQYAANLRFETAFDELWHFSIGGGPLRVVSGDVDDPGIGLSAKLQRQSETNNFGFDLSNDTIPDGRGTLSRQTQAVASFTHNFSSRLAADFSAQWTLTRDALPEFGIEFGSVTYWGASSALRWQVAPTLSASFSISWNQQLQDRGAADAYRAGLSLSWQGLERGH
jgi:hypothetical protein